MARILGYVSAQVAFAAAAAAHVAEARGRTWVCRVSVRFMPPAAPRGEPYPMRAQKGLHEPRPVTVTAARNRLSALERLTRPRRGPTRSTTKSSRLRPRGGCSGRKPGAVRALARRTRGAASGRRDLGRLTSPRRRSVASARGL